MGGLDFFGQMTRRAAEADDSTPATISLNISLTDTRCLAFSQGPTGIPFNLTPFAVTLNAIPDRLRPLVAPTDTRLRPDQRAMEEGEYDFAAVEKNRVEEGQRARRRAREARGEEFVPRWFRKARHPVTGEEYWDFRQEYWRVREEVAEGRTTWDQQGLEEIY
ncbi:Oxysterol-binding protein C2F12.05c [Friedmanniomyces simplex]|uniref:Oxysterol-binding protein C2F12.05c n=1 Tax=Friedmanniomyces simplex TaxID=329884 RepID=A0A4U0WPX5_9PEZI|nr:Oxysterol-binding protein C2F12.05c [Friedmanniomyces simplex]